ncbi:MAG TPA: hypothetical protein VFN44_00760 [Solirubrobacteraceae bacterium]|nr:hypothetical protein [Solirubrobacteraceae bacterium]
MERVLLRCIATVGGLLCIPLTLWLLGVVVVISSGAQAPDPDAPDGDPCCWHPDTWGDWALGSASTLVASLVTGLIASFGAAMLIWGVTGRRARARLLRSIPVGFLVAALALVAFVLVSTRDGSTF